MLSPLLRVDGRIIVVAAVTVGLIALAAGFLAGVPSGGVPLAYASGTHPANTACPGGNDPTVTSAMTVSHHTAPSYLGTSTVVEPNTGESWRIDAYYYPGALPAGQTLVQAWVDVDWNGSSWVASNITLPGSGEIVSVDVCQTDTCDAGDNSVHSWEYKLTVDLLGTRVGANSNSTT